LKHLDICTFNIDITGAKSSIIIAYNKMMSSSASMVRALSFKQLSKGGKLLKSQKPQKFVSPTTATIPKKKTTRAYEFILPKFCTDFDGWKIDEVAPNDILAFLDKITDGRKQQTKRTRYALI
jgi:hypothetical protein